MDENIKSILGLETEGFEKTFDQFSKISDLKNSLEGQTRLEARYKSKVDTEDVQKEIETDIKINPVIDNKKLEKEIDIKPISPDVPKDNIFSRMKDAFKLPSVFGMPKVTTGAEENEEDKKEDVAGDKFAKSVDRNTRGLVKSADAMASLDPTGLIKTFTTQKYDFIGRIASSVANSAWMGSGEGVKAVIMKAAELKNIALGAAQNSINTFKKTLPVEIQRRSDKSAAELYQGGLKASEFKEITRSDYSNIIRTVAGQYGKLQPEIIKQFRRIFSSDKGRVMNRELAGNLAQGKFSALGTDKGFFMEKIANAGAGLPPSVRQNINASLLDQIDLSKLKIEKGAARRAGKGFDESNIRLAQKTFGALVSSSDNFKNIMNANEELNNLSLIMVKNASLFSGVLKSSAADLTGFLGNLNTLIKSAQAAAGKATKDNGKTQKFNTRSTTTGPRG